MTVNGLLYGIEIRMQPLILLDLFLSKHLAEIEPHDPGRSVYITKPTDWNWLSAFSVVIVIIVVLIT